MRAGDAKHKIKFQWPKQLLGNPCNIAAGIPQVHTNYMPCVDIIRRISGLISLLIGSTFQAWTFSTNQYLPYKIIIK